MNKQPLYLFVKLKGRNNDVIEQLNKVKMLSSKQFYKDTGCVLNILGIGITNNEFRNSYDRREIVIGKNQLFILLHTDDFNELYVHTYETVIRDNRKVGMPIVDYDLFAKDESDMFDLDKLLKTSLYITINNNKIDDDTVKKLLDTRKQINKQKRNKKQ